MNRNSVLQSQGGQIIVEYILMLVVMLTVSFMVQKFLQEKNFIQGFTFQPWARLSGMVQCGTWQSCGIGQPKAGQHPNSHSRVLSLDAAGM